MANRCFVKEVTETNRYPAPLYLLPPCGFSRFPLISLARKILINGGALHGVEVVSIRWNGG